LLSLKKSNTRSRRNYTEAKNAEPKERYAEERITKSNAASTGFSRNWYIFSIVSCQKMNVLFVLDYMKRIQSQLSG